VPSSQPTAQPQNPAAELQRQEAELKALRLLVGGLAHDFNNLLTAISGHASLLEAAAAPGTDTHESATAILKAAEHAAAIAGKLQGLARRGGGHKVPVDLHEIIGEITRLLRPTTNGNIRIVERLEAPRAVTLGDPEQLYQVILNLALNARESMPQGGTLTFATWKEEPAPGQNQAPRLVVAVTDTGCGIPAADRERIFEPYYTARKPAAGSGLGLTVVAGIVSKHQGRVEVESEEGRGSVFRVYLPLLDRRAAVAGA